jgi:hypothetical protein
MLRTLALPTDWARVRGRWTDWRIPRLTWDAALRVHALTLLELVVVVAWALVVTQPYLDLDPAAIPAGQEFGSIIPAHHFWTRAQTCGWCALWNGNTQGGSPAMADPFGSTLHPVVMVPTVIWGVINGSKLALVAGFLMAGLAQWWLGRVLDLGRIACVWSGCLAIAGGHLSSRMENGALVGVIATAACALVLPPLIAVMRAPTRRAAVALGVVLGLAAVAGQGYYQVGFALISPAALLLVPRNPALWGRLARRLGLALALALLLAAPLLVPFLMFAPVWAKQTDPSLGAFQPLAYLPLNLVIDDMKFHGSDLLGKRSHPALNVIFIGWLAVLLALWGLHKGLRRPDRSALYFLLAQALLALWLASGAPMRWLASVSPSPALTEFVTGLRFGSILAGLAVAPILGLAAVGLDSLLRATGPHIRLGVAMPDRQPRVLPLVLDARWLLIVPLLLALNDGRLLGTQWIGTYRLGPEVPAVLDALRTPDLQWVDVPGWKPYWVEPAVARNLKLAGSPEAGAVERFRWRDRPLPLPVLSTGPQSPPPGMEPRGDVAGWLVYAAPPGREYAAVTDAMGARTVCTAQGLGGQVDVSCNAPHDGTLTVIENYWGGWQAAVDGRGVPVRPGRWLELELPAGQHEIQLRYRPWDVPVGLALMAAGIALAVYLWRKPEPLAPEARRGAMAVSHAT